MVQRMNRRMSGSGNGSAQHMSLSPQRLTENSTRALLSGAGGLECASLRLRKSLSSQIFKPARAGASWVETVFKADQTTY